ncbi:sialate O-acetylesterase [Sagittula stellata]|uniref:Probable acetyl xylan esterase AxeA n=1 Tax=Sagittula stellata (strain ATCC 700073 / DSM 11524 / E-37) TaxID=388399 RepID=A3K171_SAGS3|nr:sialate O-acetylesterase [Sagittula stellata]EBA06011.1 probable acetyl xylan esterase AxeA [Sagittula stellata E-37]EBA08667.1 probable acetyl xylan esterase AxeA [Sagittula stellata E-37]EBA08956.1 probable acetyl xylan esterase AxeA [Sagittula stellata E-37]
MALPGRTIAQGNPPASDHQVDQTDLGDWMEEIEEGVAGVTAISDRVSDIESDYARATALEVERGRIATLEATSGAETPQGAWAPSGGSFPGGGTAQTGDYWEATDTGTIDSVSFVAGDQIIALIDNASTSTYAGDWFKREGGAVTSVAGRTGAVVLTKSDVGLGNVDNTPDADKPVSTAQQAALDAKAPLADPAFTGTPTAPTAPAGTSTTQIATTAFVGAAVAGTVTSDQISQVFDGGEAITDGDASLADSNFGANITTYFVVPDTARDIYVTSVSVNLTGAGTGNLIVATPVGEIRYVSELLTVAGAGETALAPAAFVLPAGACYGWRRASGGSVRRGALGTDPDSFSISPATLPDVGDILARTANTYQPAVEVSGTGLFPAVSELQDLRGAVQGPDYTANVVTDAITAADGAYYDLAEVYVERTAPATASEVGQLVGTLADSANSYDMAAPADAARPRLSWIGHGPALQFDGSDDYLDSAALGAMVGDFSAGFTATVTVQPTPWLLTAAAGLLSLVDGSNALKIYIGTTSGNYIVGPGGNILGPVTDEPASITVTWSGGTFSAWLNGQRVVKGGARSVTGAAAVAMIGAFRNGGSPANFFNGKIGAVSVIESALSDADALSANLEAMAVWQESATGTTNLAEEVKEARLGLPSLALRGRYTEQGRLYGALMLGASPIVLPLIGQSNMVGQGVFDGGAGHPATYKQWLQAGSLAACTAHLDHLSSDAGEMGLSVQFAIDFAAEFPNAQLIFVPCAVSGTGYGFGNLQGGVELGRWGIGDDLYLAAVRRTDEVMRRYPQCVLGGILHHDGEDDAENSTANFADLLDEAIGGYRTSIVGASAQTPFVVGEIAQDLDTGTFPLRDTINAALAGLPGRLIHTACASSSGLVRQDFAHFNAASQRTFGSRYFTAWQSALRGWL